ncbi:unnamed protein product [Symbiodinium natans]|uniref:Sugar phosphate transporter domain-containing protein n=1 Tax=Symbiodinium natans TaxID=878477 RepID=A0A812UL84_9DINO|nr:unnamed protein product [Symbiodinium natans]
MIPSALWILLLYVRLAPALHNRSERISVVLSHDATFKTAAPVRSLWSDNVSRLIRRQSGAHNVEPGTPALPEGAVVGEVVFAVRLRKLGLTSIAGIVGAYWVTVFRETSKESPGEDRSLLSAAPQALPWMVLSLILSIFNKWIFIPSGADFPYPLTLSCCHMFTTSLVLHSLRLFKPSLFPGLREGLRSDWETFRAVLLVGGLLAVSVVLSNSAAMLLSVAFINMLKGGNSLFALALGLAVGTTQWPTALQLMWPVLIISAGAAATIHGELYLSHVGLLLLVVAILVEQFRLVLFKSMMSETGLKLDPLSALSLFAPVAFLVAAPFALGELRAAVHVLDPMRGSALILNALTAVTLNVAYSRLLKVASPVTFTVFGTAKDVATAGLSLCIVGGVVTPLQLCGYGATLFGMLQYDRTKRQQAGAQ